MGTKELRELLAAATPGPWKHDEDGALFVRGVHGGEIQFGSANNEDVAFIAAAKNHMAALLDVCEAAYAAVDGKCACDEYDAPGLHDLRTALSALAKGEL